MVSKQSYQFFHQEKVFYLRNIERVYEFCFVFVNFIVRAVITVNKSIYFAMVQCRIISESFCSCNHLSTAAASNYIIIRV